MKVSMKDCLQLCAVFLQFENVLALLSDDGGVNLSDEDKTEAERELNMLLRCANLVIHEIASEYVHLKTYESFNTTDGHIRYSDFLKQPVDIYSVKKEGNFCRFKLYPSELITQEGDVEVYYTYLPDKVETTGNLDFEEGKVNGRIIAYGTAAEYCVICGLYEEAVIWDKRYKDSLFNSVKSIKSVTLPERKWY